MIPLPLRLSPLPGREPFRDCCRQGPGPRGVVCGLRGHRSFGAAVRHAAKLNRELESLGLLSPESAWRVESES